MLSVKSPTVTDKRIALFAALGSLFCGVDLSIEFQLKMSALFLPKRLKPQRLVQILRIPAKHHHSQNRLRHKPGQTLNAATAQAALGQIR